MITSAEEFVALRLSEDPASYQRAARESAPLSVWLEVIRTRPDMKVWVTLNKTIHAEVLELLSTDDSADVRAAVATKRKLPTHCFERLANDPSATVRSRIAYNAKTPRSLLVKLAADPEWVVSKPATMRLTSQTSVS